MVEQARNRISDIMKKMATVPPSIQSFVERQKTMPVGTLCKDSGPPTYPYAEYWRRAVAAMLLSGRVAAKNNGFPNMTDVNRICKEANFSPYWFEPTARFLVSAKIIQRDWRFRHCKIKRIDRIFEFQLDKKQLTETLQKTSGEKLREMLEEAGPLPATIDHLLRSKPLSGEVRVRGCSAIVQPDGKTQLPANVERMLSEWAGKRESLVLRTNVVLALGPAEAGSRARTLSAGAFLLLSISARKAAREFAGWMVLDHEDRPERTWSADELGSVTSCRADSVSVLRLSRIAERTEAGWQITRQSIDRARTSGMTADQILRWLGEHLTGNIPALL